MVAGRALHRRRTAAAAATAHASFSPLQEAGNRAAAAGQWGAALRGFDAALAASPSSPHKLHEAKAQVRCGLLSAAAA